MLSCDKKLNRMMRGIWHKTTTQNIKVKFLSSNIARITPQDPTRSSINDFWWNKNCAPKILKLPTRYLWWVLLIFAKFSGLLSRYSQQRKHTTNRFLKIHFSQSLTKDKFIVMDKAEREQRFDGILFSLAEQHPQGVLDVRFVFGMSPMNHSLILCSFP